MRPCAHADVFEDKLYVHLVMEYCSGGELFDSIVERGRYSERDAAEVRARVAAAIWLLLVHRAVAREGAPCCALHGCRSAAAPCSGRWPSCGLPRRPKPHSPGPIHR